MIANIVLWMLSTAKLYKNSKPSLYWGYFRNSTKKMISCYQIDIWKIELTLKQRSCRFSSRAMELILYSSSTFTCMFKSPKIACFSSVILFPMHVAHQCHVPCSKTAWSVRLTLYAYEHHNQIPSFIITLSYY